MHEDRPVRSWSGPYLIVAVVIALGMLGCALIVSRALVRARSGDEVIRVIGSARKPIRSDLAIWTCRVTRDSPSVSAAYGQLSGDMARVQDYLLTNGLRKSEVSPLSVNTKTLYARTKVAGAPPVYDGNEDSGSSAIYRKPVGYRLTQEIEVRSSNVDLVDRLSRQSTQLISKGMSFESDSPQYIYTKLSELKVSMQADAARDARARAEQIAENSRSHVGNLRFARMNVPQITPLYSAKDSDGGIDDTSSIDKRITAIVVAGYSIR